MGSSVQTPLHITSFAILPMVLRFFALDLSFPSPSKSSVGKTSTAAIGPQRLNSWCGDATLTPP